MSSSAAGSRRIAAASTNNGRAGRMSRDRASSSACTKSRLRVCTSSHSKRAPRRAQSCSTMWTAPRHACSTVMKHGRSPAFSLQCFQSATQIPWQLHDPGMLARSRLDVSCAGSADFNGSYTPCGLRHGKLCYLKDGGAQMIVFHKGWWILSANGQGESFYGVRAPAVDHVAPPENAVWRRRAGRAPVPSVQCRANRTELLNLAPVDHKTKSVLLRDNYIHRAEAARLQYCVLTEGDMDFQCPAALLGSEVKGERKNGWIKVHATDSAMRSFPIELGNEVVIRDVNKFHGSCAQSALHSKGALQAPQREHRVISPQIDASKAEDCSADSTVDSLSQDKISLFSEASEVEFAGDSASSNAVFHGIEDRHLAVNTFCTGLVSQRVSTFTKLSCSKSQSLSSLTTAPGRGLTTECIRDGCVSQRVSMFTKLSSSTSRFFSSLTDVPVRGLVSERIRAHERFINDATLGGERERPLHR